VTPDDPDPLEEQLQQLLAQEGPAQATIDDVAALFEAAGYSKPAAATTARLMVSLRRTGR